MLTLRAMLDNEEEWAALVDSLQSAAFGTGSWEDALRGCARATGSRSMQLAGLASKSTVLFNVIPDIDPAIHQAFAESISINPRVPALDHARVLEVLADCDITTPETYHRSQFYNEVTALFDVPYVCLTNLEKSEDALIALAALRSHKDGHITKAQREVFTKLVPHVRAAIRMQLALEHQGAELATGMMGALSIAAFLCDRHGRVRYSTPAGEQLLSRRPEIRLVNGSLGASLPRDARALSNAIEAASRAGAGPDSPVLRTVVLGPQAHGAPPLVLDVFALRVRKVFELWSFAPRVLVVARGPRGTSLQKGAILKAVYGLTPAECEIALRLAEGRSIDMIAAERRCTVGTVRHQVKGILAKLGVSKQLELAALVAQL